MKSRPWWHYVLGCGCSAALLAVLLVVAGGAYLAHKASQSFYTDPARVEKLAADILPGARPLDGQMGVLGVEALGMRTATLAARDGAPENTLLIALMDSPDDSLMKSASRPSPSGTPVVDEKVATEKVISSEPARLSVGGRPFPAEKAKVEQAVLENGKVVYSTRFIVEFKKGKGSARILIEGPVNDFDQKGMERFLAVLDATGLEPAGGPSVSPTPSARPALSPTASPARRP